MPGQLAEGSSDCTKADIFQFDQSRVRLGEVVVFANKNEIHELSNLAPFMDNLKMVCSSIPAAPGLGPNPQSLAQVPELLIAVQSQTDVRQDAFSSSVIPEFGIHQNTIMIEEYVLLHSLDPFPGVICAVAAGYGVGNDRRPQRSLGSRTSARTNNDRSPA